MTRSKVNASAAKRILGIPLSRKIEFTESGDRVTVRDSKTGLTHLLTLHQFEEHHEEQRRAGALECVAQEVRASYYGRLFEVKGSRGDLYHVELREARLNCSCTDYNEFESTCKHGYACLNLLGFKQLGDLLTWESCRKLAEVLTPTTSRPARLTRAQGPRIIGGVTIE